LDGPRANRRSGLQEPERLYRLLEIVLRRELMEIIPQADIFEAGPAESLSVSPVGFAAANTSPQCTAIVSPSTVPNPVSPRLSKRTQ
jgi:hypothetical protein